MKKILGLILITVILASCGSQFSQSRYGRYMWNRSNGKNITEEKEVVQEKSTQEVKNNNEKEPVSFIDEKVNEDKNTFTTKAENKTSNKTTSVKVKKAKSTNHYSNAVSKKPTRVNKVVKQIVKRMNKNNPYQEDVDAMWIVTLILCFLIPPLGVYLKDGSLTGLFWLVLILCLLGGGLSFGIATYYGGLYFVGTVLALLRFFDII